MESAVVNEFPPPPSYYLDFQDETSPPLPPPLIPPVVETYGGMIPPPSLDIQLTGDEQNIPVHLLPKHLKQYVIYLFL